MFSGGIERDQWHEMGQVRNHLWILNTSLTLLNLNSFLYSLIFY